MNTTNFPNPYPLRNEFPPTVFDEFPNEWNNIEIPNLEDLKDQSILEFKGNSCYFHQISKDSIAEISDTEFINNLESWMSIHDIDPIQFIFTNLIQDHDGTEITTYIYTLLTVNP